MPFQNTQKSLINNYSLKNIHVLYNTFDSSRIIKDQVIRKEKSLLFVESTKEKKFTFLLDVIEQLPHDIHLTIVGAKNSSEFNIDFEIKNRNLSNQVSNLGFVDQSTLNHLYKTSTALIFPSLLEGFGYPIIEAAAYNLPVICSNKSALPEIGHDGCYILIQLN